MKHQTATLEGALLDAAVAKAEGWTLLALDGWGGRPGWANRVTESSWPMHQAWADEWKPSTEWHLGGPIIQRERIAICRCDPTVDAEDARPGEPWNALARAIITMDSDSVVPEEDPGEEGALWGFGPTPLIAAMRAYVASRLGEEVDP